MSAGLETTPAGPVTSPSPGSAVPAAPAGPTVGDIVERHGGGGVGSRGLTVVRGVGARLEDDRGRLFIDCVGGQGSASLGHAHPTLVAAI
ncbi:MAG: hypothetical protein AAFY88_09170, partial [Acidobacteriota bacterium]